MIVTRTVAAPERYSPIEPTWLEEYEEIYARGHLALGPPPPSHWPSLVAEQEEMRQALRHGVVKSMGFDEVHTQNFRQFGTFKGLNVTATDYDIHNVVHYNLLPSVRRWKARALADMAKSRVITTQEMADMAASEFTHTLYHLALWKRYGRRVYVLDEGLYQLLAHTPLPDLPASILAPKLPAFYIKFPRGAFKFGTRNPATGQEEIERADGVQVAFDSIVPDTERGREMAFVVAGTGEALASDDGMPAVRNIAYISAGLGHDAKLSEVRFETGGRYAAHEHSGGVELAELVPRVILGLILYLQSEHPDLEPVPAPAPRDLGLVTSARKLAKARRKAARQSKLGYIYVGRREGAYVRAQQDAMAASSARSGWTLDHQVWVTGHRKMQRCGPNGEQRKLVWIKPYLKGPDYAEAIVVRAARVQPGRIREGR